MFNLAKFWERLFKVSPDPCRECELYKDHGCAHVDGFLCDVRTCKESIQYRIHKQEKNNEYRG